MCLDSKDIAFVTMLLFTVRPINAFKISSAWHTLRFWCIYVHIYRLETTPLTLFANFYILMAQISFCVSSIQPPLILMDSLTSHHRAGCLMLLIFIPSFISSLEQKPKISNVLVLLCTTLGSQMRLPPRPSCPPVSRLCLKLWDRSN